MYYLRSSSKFYVKRRAATLDSKLQFLSQSLEQGWLTADIWRRWGSTWPDLSTTVKPSYQCHLKTSGIWAQNSGRVYLTEIRCDVIISSAHLPARCFHPDFDFAADKEDRDLSEDILRRHLALPAQVCLAVLTRPLPAGHLQGIEIRLPLSPALCWAQWDDESLPEIPGGEERSRCQSTEWLWDSDVGVAGYGGSGKAES